MGGCPVRPCFCSIAVDPRILTSGWYTNPTFLNSRYGFSTLLAPYPQYRNLWTRIRAVSLSPFMTYTDPEVLESFTLWCLFPACYSPLSLSGSSSHYLARI